MEATKLHDLLAWLEIAQAAAERMVDDAESVGDLYSRGNRGGMYLAYSHVVDKVRSML
jgi:hypothetical protein